MSPNIIYFYCANSKQHELFPFRYWPRGEERQSRQQVLRVVDEHAAAQQVALLAVAREPNEPRKIAVVAIVNLCAQNNQKSLPYKASANGIN